MPVRLLREGILDSSAVNGLTFPAEVFYRRLMSVVDDFGRFDGRPAVLRGRLYALKLDTVREADISRWIAECVKAGLLALYEADAKPYLLFLKLGTPRAKESKYPAPSEAIGVATRLHADANGRAQPLADAPYSDSYSDSYSGSDSSACAAAGTAIPAELDTEEFRRAWGEWKAERAAKRTAPYTPRGEKGQLKKLAPFGPTVAVLAIRESIAQGWQGLFPEKVARVTSPPAMTPALAIRPAKETPEELVARLRRENAPKTNTQESPCTTRSNAPTGTPVGSPATAAPSASAPS